MRKKTPIKPGERDKTGGGPAQRRLEEAHVCRETWPRKAPDVDPRPRRGLVSDRRFAGSVGAIKRPRDQQPRADRGSIFNCGCKAADKHLRSLLSSKSND